MNILMILAGHDFPPDIRVEKEMMSLLEAGHTIYLACDQIKNRSTIEDWNGIKIIRRKRIPVPNLFEKFNGIPGWLKILDKQWAAFLDLVIQEHGVQAIHSHDLPKSGAAIAAGKKWGLPVILDLHENFPGSMETYIEGWTGWRYLVARTLIRPQRWHAYEKIQVMSADHVISVVDEAANRLAQLGQTKDAITVIENTAPIETYESDPIDETLINRYADEFVVLYIGGFGGRGDHRGVTTAIEAMPNIIKEIPNVRLLLVGKGSVKMRLEQMVKDRNIKRHVTFVDWVPQNTIRSYIACSSVCLVPYNSTPNTEASCPNKLFQYMYMGKPIVVSSCESLKRYVAETGAGKAFQAGDGEDLARVVVGLKDAPVRDDLGKQGKEAVRNKYNWEKTAKSLVGLYERISPK